MQSFAAGLLQALSGKSCPQALSPRPLPLCARPQMYSYASSVFHKAGIPSGLIQYVIIGTGSCELISAVTCVRIPAALSPCRALALGAASEGQGMVEPLPSPPLGRASLPN